MHPGLPLRRTLVRILFPVLFFTCIGFASLEGILSVYYSYHPELYKKDPFTNAHIVEEYNSPYVYIHLFKPDEIYKRNNFLMRRDTDISESPRDGVTRILSYGDSVGLGFQVSSKETYSQVLEDMLNQSGSGYYEVLNMARGNSPSIYAMHMKRDIEQFKPHRIIVEIELSNDIADETFVEYGGFDSFNLPTQIVKSRYWPEWQTMPPISTQKLPWETLATRKFLYDFNRKFNVLANNIFPNPVFASDADNYYYSIGFDRFGLTQKKLDKAYERMFVVLKSMEEYAKTKGIDFLLVILPNHYMYYENQFNQGTIRMYNKSIEKSKELGITHIGLFDAFSQNIGFTLFYDFVHPKAPGYYIIADQIHSFYKSLTN